MIAEGQISRPDSTKSQISGETVSERILNSRRKRKNYGDVDEQDFIQSVNAGEDPYATQNEMTPEEKEELRIKKLEKERRAKINAQHLNSKSMALRQIAAHPFLIDRSYDLCSDEQRKKPLLDQSGKMQVLARLLPELLQRGHKILIFSGFPTSLEFIHEWLEGENLECYRLDGGQNYRPSQEDIDDFNTNKSKDAIKLFLLSTRAGGVGITLTGADTVILFDSDWNPQADLQAMDRSHRIGQKKPVIVLRLETVNSIDQIIQRTATGKRALEKEVLDENTFKGGEQAKIFAKTKSKKSAAETREDLLVQAFEQATQEDYQFAPKGKIFTDEQVEQLLDRSPATMKSNQLAKLSGKPLKGKPLFEVVKTALAEGEELDEQAVQEDYD